MKKLINKARCLVALIILLTIEAQANLTGSNGEEYHSGNDRNLINYGDEAELKTRTMRADDLKFYRTYVEGSYCDIEVSNPNGKYEIVFRDKEGNICEKYSSELVDGIDMDQVSNSTIPLIQTSDIDSRDRITGIVRISDLISLVRKKAQGGEEIQVHPIKNRGTSNDDIESTQWFNWGNFTQNNFGNFDNQY